MQSRRIDGLVIHVHGYIVFGCASDDELGEENSLVISRTFCGHFCKHEQLSKLWLTTETVFVGVG